MGILRTTLLTLGAMLAVGAIAAERSLHGHRGPVQTTLDRRWGSA